MSNFAFNSTPVIRHRRSRFDLSHGVKTSGNVGTLYPFEVQEVVPGDTFKVHTASVSRLTSQFLRPVMDNLFLDTYWFFVPSRLLYDKFVNVFGENTESAWANTVEYQTPQIPEGQVFQPKTVGDYLHLNANGGPHPAVSVLPFRAFAKIYNEWFRDQNNVAPMHIQTGEYNESEAPNSNPWGPGNYTGLPPKVAKFHDFFTSLLPAPQKGDAPSIPVVSSTSQAPVVTSNNGLAMTGAQTPVRWGMSDGSNVPGSSLLAGFAPSAAALQKAMNVAPGTPAGSWSSAEGLYPANLFANLAEADFSSVTVNELRFAFQYQKMLERDARSGSRYVEYIASHFNVQAGDYRLQRSEFLGGRRTPISIHQVVQSTGSGSEDSPLGEVAAYAQTSSRSGFTKSFVEHGFVIGVYCIRQHHTYQQAVEPFWFRTKRTDYYDPVFAHIGEQPVYAKTIYAQAGLENRVFGYGEAWVDMRARFNTVSGQMRSSAPDTLDYWHFGDNYANVPVLGQDFIEETPQYVDRTITVNSAQQDQFILDFWVGNIAYRPLPTYSVPSLIDHD